jgi:hypothetical protein
MNSPENPRSRSGVAGLALEARNVVAGTICLPLKIGRCHLRKCGDYKVPKAAFCDDRLNLARVIVCTPDPTSVRHALVIKAAGHSAVSRLPPPARRLRPGWHFRCRSPDDRMQCPYDRRWRRCRVSRETGCAHRLNP